MHFFSVPIGPERTAMSITSFGAEQFYAAAAITRPGDTYDQRSRQPWHGNGGVRFSEADGHDGPDRGEDSLSPVPRGGTARQ